MRDYGDALSPIDVHFRELVEWLLSENPQTRSPVLMECTARILRELAELAEARGKVAKAWRDYTRAAPQEAP